MAEEKKWYETGYDGADRVEEQRQQSAVRRFWMPENSEAEITFLDDAPFSIWEHNLKLNGNWRNFFTCLKNIPGVDSCPLCDDGSSAYYVGFFTVIDHREWEDNKGNKHQHEVKLFGAKLNVIKKLKRQAERHGGLRGKKFTVFRADGKTPNTGDDFDFLGEVDLSKEFLDEKGNEQKPFAYEEILAPKKEKYLMRIVGESDSGEDEGDGGDGEEKVPF